MKVALIGGTGYVGSYIVDELIASGHKPRLLVRPGSESKILCPNDCEQVLGTLEEEEALRDVLSGCDAVIFLVAVIREFPKEGITNNQLQFRGAERVAKVATNLKVKRFLLMSALGANGETESSKYFIAKHLSEQIIKNTELDWTIFRPSSVFGDPRGQGRPEFCSELKESMLNLVPFPNFLPFPAPSFFTGVNPFDAGQFSLSLVHIKDLAKILVKTLDDQSAFGQTLEIGGEDITWNDIIKSIAEASEKKIIMTPAPFFVVWIAAMIFDRFKWFPATRDQLQDLVNGNTCNSNEIFKKYEIDPIPFNVSNLNYLNK